MQGRLTVPVESDSAYRDGDAHTSSEDRVASSHSNYEVNAAEMANEEGDCFSPKEALLPTLKMEDLTLKLNRPTSQKKSKTPLRTSNVMNKNAAEKLITQQ